MTRLTVTEASAAYEAAMRNVRPAGPGVCARCHTFIDPSYAVCLTCSRQANTLDVVTPITYSEHLGQLHTALRNYKDGPVSVQRYAMVRLAAILWRFVATHEPCIARAAGVQRFDVVTSVPSDTPARDEERRNLRTIVGWCEPLGDRFSRVLRSTGSAVGRSYDEHRYVVTDRLDGRSVLLIDDTWASGGHAQSAGHALRRAGANAVALIAIGRHVQPGWRITEDETSGERLAALPRRFDWATCCVH